MKIEDFSIKTQKNLKGRLAIDQALRDEEQMHIEKNSNRLAVHRPEENKAENVLLRRHYLIDDSVRTTSRPAGQGRLESFARRAASIDSHCRFLWFSGCMVKSFR
ncbi:MAG: hypothetical protein ONB12_08545 [candidate division KSB1 bacterium]|nr:hypothetical protein [candidate division KSB1 bacterium]